MPSNSFSSYRLLAQKIADSKTFSTSKVYQQLLTYLTEAALKDEEGKTLNTYAQTGPPDAYHTDYGLAAKFPGLRDNFILIFSGFHDTGVLQAVNSMTNPLWLDHIEEQLRQENDSLSRCFEILFRAQGIDRTEFDTEIVHLRALSADLNVWQTDNED